MFESLEHLPFEGNEVVRLNMVIYVQAHLNLTSLPTDFIMPWIHHTMVHTG